MQEPGRLSGERWNALQAQITQRHRARVEMLVDLFTFNGYPPFTEPRDEREQYMELVALRAANSDIYWRNPQAQADLERLSERYGKPPAVRPFAPTAGMNSAMGGQMQALAGATRGMMG